jgi:hypothetical protein
MDAQKMRTPKGLDFLASIAGTTSHQETLYCMGEVSQVHATIWFEGVWEVLRCDRTAHKFIVSDHPVTTYNKRLFPGAKECAYPRDAPIELLGTHTIFPLAFNRCLVVTNLGYVRNPEGPLLKPRENPRIFGDTIRDLRTVQTGREIGERDVLAINYIVKMRARRFIAAAKEEWLYPEDCMKSRMWDRLSDSFFLMPDPRRVSFTSGTFVGWKDGSSWGMDEYGRRPNDHDQEVTDARSREWQSFCRAKARWDRRFGELDSKELFPFGC